MATPKLINPLVASQLNLTSVVAATTQRLGWDGRKAQHAELWYRRFLYLTQKSSKRGNPVAVFGIEADSDELWHDHIVNTAKYFEDCQRMFGGYLNHKPGTPAGWQRLLADAEQLYVTEFGVGPPFANTCCT